MIARSVRQSGDPLRVGLNLTFLGERAGGIGRYATELPGALLEAEPTTDIHVFVSRDAPPGLREEPWADSVRWTTIPVRLGGPSRVLGEYLALPALAVARGLDVLHNPANTAPGVVPGVASVVSLHDLIWLHRGAEWEQSAYARRRMRVLVRHSVRHADLVFAISHAAADDLVTTLGVPRDLIEVTPLGVRPPGDAPASEIELRASLQLGSARVVMCVAQKRPYKNLRSLIAALPMLAEDVVLVLPGSPTAYERELRDFAQDLGVGPRVRFPDWLSNEQLEGLYACADSFVLPSLMEGFGLPVLEAMARGVPVACSNVPALAEVGGDAALMFDPERQEEVTGAIARLLSDAGLATRLVERGRERVRRYSWRRTGELSLRGYRRAIARSSG